MNIAQMHVAFRQYAQQMGMQNVRAILPEQIDVFLNQSITDTVNQLIRENIGVTNDRVITDNSKIGQINAFRTLYDVFEKRITFDNTIEENDVTLPQRFTYNPENRITGLIKHTYADNNGSDELFGNYMFLVDISINYRARGSENIVTAWYPVRIIDDAYLSDTLNDFVLKNRFRSPIAVVYKNSTLELYIDKFDVMAQGETSPKITVTGNQGVVLTPYQLRISVIKPPQEVKFTEDIQENSSKNCDLPESMHGDIVKRAVDLYHVAVNGSLHAAQDAEQVQQPENVRNNYRNENNQ